MEINIRKLPSILFWAIIKKFVPAEYVKLHRTCKEIHDCLLTRKNIIPLQCYSFIVNQSDSDITIDAVPFRNHRRILHTNYHEELQCFRISFQQMCILPTLDTQILPKLIIIIEDLKLTSEEVYIDGTVKNFHLFDDFLKKIQPRKLKIASAVTRSIIPPSTFENIEVVELCETDYGNDELLAMSQSEMMLICPKVTSTGIIAFIMKWINGTSHIRKVHILQTSPLSIDTIVDNVPTSLLYKTLAHSDSIIHELPMLPFSETLRSHQFYILWRSENVFNQIILDIGTNSVVLEAIEDPKQYVLSCLFDYEYATITRRCQTCELPLNECNCNYE